MNLVLKTDDQNQKKFEKYIDDLGLNKITFSLIEENPQEIEKSFSTIKYH